VVSGVNYCHTEGRKSSGVKRMTRHGRGSPIKDGITDKSSERWKGAKAQADSKSSLKVLHVVLADITDNSIYVSK